MSIDPLRVMPAPLWRMTYEYCQSMPLLNWVFPEIYATGSFFKTGAITITSVKECDQHQIKEFIHTLQKTVQISEALKQAIAGRKVLDHVDNIVVVAIDNEGFEVWRDEEERPQLMWSKERFKVDHGRPYGEGPVTREGVTILKDLSGLIVVTGAPMFYMTMDGKQQTQIELSDYTAHAFQVFASETALSFINGSAFFQYPLKGPFNRPAISFELAALKGNDFRFEPEINSLFYADNRDNHLQRLEVATQQKTRLYPLDPPVEFSSYFWLQSNILIRQNPQNISIWNGETGTLLRMIDREKDLGLHAKAWIVAFDGASIYFACQKDPTEKRERGDKRPIACVISKVTFSTPEPNAAPK